MSQYILSILFPVFSRNTINHLLYYNYKDIVSQTIFNAVTYNLTYNVVETEVYTVDLFAWICYTFFSQAVFTEPLLTYENGTASKIGVDYD